MSDVVIDDPSVTRVPLRERPQRGPAKAEENAGPRIDVGDAEPGDHPNPEDQLADIAKSLEASQAQTRAAEERARNEAEHRTRAEREAQRLRSINTTSREAVEASAVESAASAVAAAESAYIQALENADIPGQVKAQKDLAAATTRHVNATTRLAELKEAKGDPTGSAGNMTEPGAHQTQQAGNMDPRAQAWIDKHPRFKSDRGYRDAVLAVHAQAVNDGIEPNSTAYFRELDQIAGTLEGNGDQGGRQMGDNGGSRRDPGFNGARSTNGGGANSGGSRVVQTALGAVTVGRKSDGTVTLRVDPGKAEDFKEGASICNMEYGEYVYEQVKIAEEQANGGSAGLQHTGERVYR